MLRNQFMFLAIAFGAWSPKLSAQPKSVCSQFESELSIRARAAEIRRFIYFNYRSILIDVANGEGIYLESLSSLIEPECNGFPNLEETILDATAGKVNQRQLSDAVLAQFFAQHGTVKIE